MELRGHHSNPANLKGEVWELPLAGKRHYQLLQSRRGLMTRQMWVFSSALHCREKYVLLREAAFGSKCGGVDCLWTQMLYMEAVNIF